MNWLNGCVLSWHWHGHSFNLGGSKLNFLFAKISFDMNVKGHRNPSWPRSSQERLKNSPL